MGGIPSTFTFGGMGSACGSAAPAGNPTNTRSTAQIRWRIWSQGERMVEGKAWSHIIVHIVRANFPTQQHVQDTDEAGRGRRQRFSGQPALRIWGPGRTRFGDFHLPVAARRV